MSETTKNASCLGPSLAPSGRRSAQMLSTPSDERTVTASSTGQLVAIASCRHSLCIWFYINTDGQLRGSDIELCRDRTRGAVREIEHVELLAFFRDTGRQRKQHAENPSIGSAFDRETDDARSRRNRGLPDVDDHGVPQLA